MKSRIKTVWDGLTQMEEEANNIGDDETGFFTRTENRADNRTARDHVAIVTLDQHALGGDEV